MITKKKIHTQIMLEKRNSKELIYYTLLIFCPKIAYIHHLKSGGLIINN